MKKYINHRFQITETGKKNEFLIQVCEHTTLNEVAQYVMYRTQTSIGIRSVKGFLPKKHFDLMWTAGKIWLKGRYSENFIWESDITDP